MPLFHKTQPFFSKVAQKHQQCLYFLFRVLVGFLFLQHGAQKLGLLDGTFGVQGLMGFIGVCEFVGGIAIVLGVLTRLVAVLGTIQLIAAYVVVHMVMGMLPIVNKGELALLYVASFAILFLYGAGKWSLEKHVLKKELF